MISANSRNNKVCFTKIAVVLSFIFLVILGTGTIASAAEITTDSTAAKDVAQVTDDTSGEDSASEGLTADGVVLGPGYFIDEQGQVYYDESLIALEEPVILSIPEEDSTDSDVQDTTDVPVTIDDQEETKADASKSEDTKDTKEQVKQDKEPEVKKPSYSEAELRLLSCLIYAEAGNQPYKGMLAVANVVINRAKSDVYWHVNTIKEVIYDRKWSVQFSVTIKSNKTGLSALDKALKRYDTGKYTGPNPEAEKTAMKRAIKAAKDALEGKNNIGNYLCFTYKGVSGSIKKKYPDYKIIGDHIFYRTK